MRKISQVLLAMAILLTAVVAVEARTPKTPKSKPAKSEKTKKVKVAKPPKLKSRTVWLCGVAFSETDSTAYITELQKLDSVYLDARNNFLADRQMYSMQLKAYLEDGLGCRHMMAAVLHSTKPKRAMKRRAKAMRRFRSDPVWNLNELSEDAFQFSPERWTKPEE